MIDFIDRADCTGCKMCMDICTYKAISFRSDREGFWYPSVNRSKCVNCGLCKSKCPNLAEFKNNKAEPKVFAAWSKNKPTRVFSTSGGLFYELAKHIILRGGIAVGAKYTPDYKSIFHAPATNLRELKHLIRSKYSQSDSAGIYKTVKNYLEEGKEVLFCGSPCQNAALTNFLGREYANLFLCDFICRGMNSPIVFKKYVSDIEKKYDSPVCFIQFKNKSMGWNQFGTFMRFRNGKTYYKDRYHDFFTIGYIIENLYIRPSCHRCHYKSLPRIADISLGDFWGVKQSGKHLDADLGTSVVLINSEKGQQLFDRISNNIAFYPQHIGVVSKGNPCLLYCPPQGTKRQQFFDELHRYPFSSLVKRCSVKKHPNPNSFASKYLHKYAQLLQKRFHMLQKK